MFSLSLIEKDVRLPPHLLNLPLPDAIRSDLESSFLDKVIPQLGLCVSVYDIRAIKGGTVAPGEGRPSYQVTLRLVMFRPFIGEIILGKIEDCDKNGIRVSLGFFDDILIPSYHFPQPSTYNETYGTWIWMPYGEGDENGLMLARGEKIRFQVLSVKYSPTPVYQEANQKPFAPMEIIGSIEKDGLGVPAWW